MKTLLRSILVLTLGAAASFAQQWEFGGVGGGGFLNSVPVSGGIGSATAGFQTGAALGGYECLGHADESDIDSVGATLGGYERGCIVAVQFKVFLPGFAGAVRNCWAGVHRTVKPPSATFGRWVSLLPP